MRKKITVRGESIVLDCSTRSLELCSQMNYEVENLDFIDSLPKNSCYLDIGACEGRFSIYAKKRGLNVYSFEPEKRNFEILLQNHLLNSMDTSNCFNLGLAEFETESIMRIGQPWAGGHQKVIDNDNERVDLTFDTLETQVVQIIDLDTCLNKFKIPTPKAIKIDIDGSEVPFMKGALKTLSNADVNKILFELQTEDMAYQWIIDQIISCGFSLIQTFNIPNEPNLKNHLFEKLK